MNDKKFEHLMSLIKYFDKPNLVAVPQIGDNLNFGLHTNSTQDSFIFDLDRSGKIELKFKNQLRKESILLVRMDINGPPHINPDGEAVSGSHIHIYKEGYGLKWAHELEEKLLTLPDKTNVLDIFRIFCDYCNISLENISIQGVI